MHGLLQLELRVVTSPHLQWLGRGEDLNYVSPKVTPALWKMASLAVPCWRLWLSSNSEQDSFSWAIIASSWVFPGGLHIPSDLACLSCQICETYCARSETPNK